MKSAVYRLRRRVSGFDAAAFAGVDPLLARIFAARGVCGGAELDYALNRLADVSLLRGIDVAAARLAHAVEHQESVLVVGDFDADGATSTALALRGLRAMGARCVDYLVPNRFEFGYGLTPEIVAVALQRRPGLIVTVDNGIASVDGVAAANASGVDVLITDHHLPGAALPQAAAIVNPNQPGDEFPSKHLAGVGVVFYLLIALRRRLRENGWFSRQRIADPNLAQFLDLVALGTVADVVPLDYNNRILVEQGLRRIRSGAASPGVLALLQIAKRTPQDAVSTDLGFAAGPRLNAAGRLEDMSLGIECLLTDDAGKARELAQRLDELNGKRREIEADMQVQAQEALAAMHLDAADLPWGLALYGADWHQGVIGILAARIRERVHRPVIAFAEAGDGTLKGSARSIPGLHIRDTLDWIATRYPGLISRFGGHAMAAGLALDRARLPEFSEVFDAAVRALLPAESLEPEVLSDGPLQPEALTLATAKALSGAGPWGQAFPAPLFDGEFEIIRRRLLGERHIKFALRPLEGERIVDGIIFNTSEHEWPAEGEVTHLAYRIEVNRYQDNETVQLMIQQQVKGTSIDSLTPRRRR